MAFDMEKFLDEAASSFEKIGLYTARAQVGAIPTAGANMEMFNDQFEIEEAMRNGMADFFVVMTMRVNDVAFSERVLEPEKFKEKTTFQEIMPTELEMLRSEAAEELKDWDKGLD